MNHPLSIALVDDDKAILDSLSLYLRTKGIDVECFECAETLLKALSDGSSFDCIVSDLQMPGLTGVELQNALSALRVGTPLIVITGHGDVETAVSAIKAGARDFLEKPFDEDRLIATMREAVASASRDQLTAQELADLRKRISDLSDRQREVMDLAVKGLTNKEIASALRNKPAHSRDSPRLGHGKDGSEKRRRPGSDSNATWAYQ